MLQFHTCGIITLLSAQVDGARCRYITKSYFSNNKSLIFTNATSIDQKQEGRKPHQTSKLLANSYKLNELGIRGAAFLITAYSIYNVDKMIDTDKLNKSNLTDTPTIRSWWSKI